ncbi:hypothetical protein [Roseiconus lacunae]|uniref:hypothetical protein n=1 Tax=Roseiconus lacunae TaxID=2605694 RepID=UPI0011F2EE75|nr:hypothetical protein [Roseiconus lacunae]
MPRHAFFLYLLLTIPLIVGCEGCRRGPSDPGANGEQAAKEAYTVGKLIGYPDDQNSTFGAMKPGHWMSAEQSIRSNQNDSRGELFSQATTVLRDRNMNQVGTLESIKTVRPVVLPRGQMRGFDFRFHVPLPSQNETRRISLSSRMVPRSGGVLDAGGQPFVAMSGSEYFFVVLTSRPARFTRFQTSNWASFKSGTLDMEVQANNYRVVVPKVDGGILPLPETMLDMTSIAAVFWDDVSEDSLTPLQQSALADWVRFGGRLIVNGPAASDAVANTALLELLPLEPTSNIELDGNAAATMLSNHSVKDDLSLAKQRNLLLQESSRVAIDGRLNSGSESIDGTESLVLRKRFGRGAVVQPRFDLTESWLQDWESYDSFVNSVILNRPARAFVVSDFSQAIPGLGDAPTQPEEIFPEDLQLAFVDTSITADAAANTQFRLASRDAILPRVQVDGETKTPGSVFDQQHRIHPLGGIASWNDDSDLMQVLRETLTSQAGIEIPDSSLVVRSLLIYLVILVPVNYIVFRLMNRLEYAWFAVPLIAVIGAVWAARQARLDIGFARSNTELAFVEAHAGYPRAHLTRLMGVYNSLSSRYKLQFRTADGVAMPLIDEANPDTTVQPEFHVSFEEGPALVDFAVASNRMRFVHSEEMVDMGGEIRLESDGLVTNQTDWELLDVIVARRGPDDEIELAVVGTLGPGEAQPPEFRDARRTSISEDLPMGLQQLMSQLTAATAIPQDSTRLICRIDGRIDGLEITPNASQHSAQTVMLVHLEQPPFPRSEPDANLVSAFTRSIKPDDAAEAPASTTSDNDPSSSSSN